jgi:ubiquinone/menaquinone biosynthesis C-methylase UbiE
MDVFRCLQCGAALRGFPPSTPCADCGRKVGVRDGIYLFADAPAVRRGDTGSYVGYDEVAEGYDKFNTPPDLGRQLFEAYAEAVRGLVEGPVILDLGCGPGPYALELAQRGKQVIAGDVSLEMLLILSSRMTIDGQGLVVPCRISAYELPFVDSSVDAVLAFNLLHFLGEPGKSVEEARRVLRRGGRFVTLGKVSTEAVSQLAPVRRYYSEAIRELGGEEAKPPGWTSRKIRENLPAFFGNNEPLTISLKLSYSYTAGWDLEKLKARYSCFQVGIDIALHERAIALVEQRLEDELGSEWKNDIVECTSTHSLLAFDT